MWTVYYMSLRKVFFIDVKKIMTIIYFACLCQLGAIRSAQSTGARVTPLQ